jgi:hypothetical protein
LKYNYNELFNSYNLYRLDNGDISNGEYHILKISEHALSAFSKRYEEDEFFREKINTKILQKVRSIKLRDILSDKKPL